MDWRDTAWIDGFRGVLSVEVVGETPTQLRVELATSAQVDMFLTAARDLAGLGVSHIEALVVWIELS
jgi:hypothetical protein